MKEGVTSHGGSKLPSPAGQGNEVVEQMANSGRGEAAKIQPLSPEPSNASCLHCSVDLVGVLSWPTEDGEIWDGQKEREVSLRWG